MKIKLDHKHKHKEEGNHDTPIAAYTVKFEATTKEDLIALKELFKMSNCFRTGQAAARAAILSRHPTGLLEASSMMDIMGQVAATFARLQLDNLPSMSADLGEDELISKEQMARGLADYDAGASEVSQQEIDDLDINGLDKAPTEDVSQKELDKLLEKTCAEIDALPLLSIKQKEEKKRLLKNLHELVRLIKARKEASRPILH